MYRKLSLFAFLILMVVQGLMAQGQTVTGRVTGEAGDPLPGANVLVQGTTRGVITNPEGEYSIRVDANAVLRFSFVG